MRALLGLIVLLVPAPAAAQYRVEPPSAEPSEGEMARARARFLEGGQQVEEGRWADALSAYEEAYRLSGIPAALFNTATTLRSMGRHRDARDLFRQLLELSDLDDETRAEAEQRLREEAGRVALILVVGLGDAPDARVALDGRDVPGPPDDPLALETDPGEHAVSVLRDGYAPWREAVTLDDGGRETLRVELEPIDREEFWESPILWTIVGVVLAGGAVLTGVLLYDDAQLDPRPGFDGTVIEL